MNWRYVIAVLSLLASLNGLPAASTFKVVGNLPGNGETNSNPHLVFAHYMVAFATYGESVEAYRKEIMEAQAANIDGFALNVGAWDDIQSYYKRRVELIYQAAEQLGTGFKLFFSVDFEDPTNIVNMVESYANRTNSFRYQGKIVLSSYGHNDVPSAGWPGMDWTNAILGKLRQDGYPVFFIPYFFSDPVEELPNSIDATNVLNKYAGILDGLFDFAVGGELEDTIASNAQYAYVVNQSGKVSMTSVYPNYWGCVQYTIGRRYYESLGGEGTELQWDQLIGYSPDWVEIVTWNDFNESTYVSPAINPGQYPQSASISSPRRNTHAGYLELSKYYITWYKSGSQPAIDRDALFYFYRIQPRDLMITNDIPVTWIAQYVQDELFLTTMLKSPARLVVTSGGVRTEYEQASGISHVRVPFQVGAQTFELWRGGSRLGLINAPPVTTSLTNYNFFPTSGFCYMQDCVTNPPAVLPLKAIKVGNQR
jgi:glucan endo-1,3-alpha-glucosidase